MTRAKPEFSLKPKLLAVSVAACFALNAGPLRANPSGPTVAHGSVGFNGLGTSALTITNQGGGNAIINWNGFSIGINELTKFQQFANLAVLNRVTGSEISSILGALQSDGRVFLINPNGIVFGASARIDVAGMVASSLNLSDQDFLSSKLRFTEVPGAGAVVNNGVIETATGGRVYLVAPTVENNGLIHARQGEILLAAGKEVELVDGDSPFVTVKVTAGAEQALNVGNLVAEGGRIGMFGALVRNSGTVEAGGAMVGPGGEIRLVATKDLTLDAGSLAAANGTSGGKILLQAEGGTNLVGGTVEAKGSAGAGGEIQALGVRVGVVGHGLIDASGETGGGTVLVGGDYQGKNASVQNAERTYIGSDGVIRADAMTTGDGGRVIVWADGDTRFFGSISAKGGSQSGNGGFVETSGKDILQAFGTVTVGNGGTWLLDPGNINIVSSNNGADDATLVYGGILAFTDGPAAPASSTIGVNSIETAMGSFGSVVLQAVEDITLQANVDVASTGSLSMSAGDDIHLGTFSITTHGNLTLTAADGQSGGTPVTGAITALPGGGNLTTNGGSVNLSGWSVQVGNINTSAPIRNGFDLSSVTVQATNGSVSTGSIVTRALDPAYCADGCGYILQKDGGDVNVTATGDILVLGGIDTRGTNGVSDFGDGSDGGAVSLTSSYGAVQVAGLMNSSGGNGASGIASAYGAIGGSGGDGGDVYLQGASVTFGPLVSLGGNGGSGGNVSGGGSTYIDVGGGSGGDGGDIDVYATGALTVTGAIDVSAGAGGNGGTGSVVENASFISRDVYASGGSGDNAGDVYLSGASIAIQTIISRGGAGGSGGSASVSITGDSTYAYTTATGGYGGDGGDIQFNASTGNVSTGTIDVRGAAGGLGGSANSSIVHSDPAYGGQATSYAYAGYGGAGGSVNSYAYGSTAIGDILAMGAGGGNGGSASASVSGTSGNSYAYAGADGGGSYFGGYVDLYSVTGSLSTGMIDARSANGGAGGTTSASVSGATMSASASAYARGGDGGEFGGSNTTYLYGATGVATGAIVGAGGNGGAGGSAIASVSGSMLSGTSYAYADASGGYGNAGNFIGISSAGQVATGLIDIRGGSGGAGGNASAAASGNSALYADAYARGGGAGGQFYYGSGGMEITSGSLITGTIAALGGFGGAGGSASATVGGAATTVPSASANASGGYGGSGYQLYLDSLGNMSTGMIDVRGGDGASGGTAVVQINGASGTIGNYSDASGGYGGAGGYIGMYSETGAIATGTLVAAAGNGASGGFASIGGNSVGATPWATSHGGGSYYGGSVYIQAGSTVKTGAILAQGGSGANAGSTSGSSQASNGGSGGFGGNVYVYGMSTVDINLNGTLGAVAINVAGGSGGTGAPASSPAGAGGSGGSGGGVGVYGTPDMTLYGSVLANGGAGGAGGAGSGSFAGGAGGTGGGGGSIFLDASSTTGAAIGDGIIYVLAGTTFNTLRGLGGVGGADGGAGSGPTGSEGIAIQTTWVQGSDYFGTIVVLDPLSVPGVNEGFQQVVEGNDDTTAFVGGEKEEEEEDKSQKELGSCKG